MTFEEVYNECIEHHCEYGFDHDDMPNLVNDYICEYFEELGENKFRKLEEKK